MTAFLESKSTDNIATDNGDNALLDGALYFDTTLANALVKLYDQLRNGWCFLSWHKSN